MFRYLVILLIAAASSAPQLPHRNSDITYVKIQPLANQRVSKLPYRESRIENLPLTIPGTVTHTGFKKDIEKSDSSLKRPQSKTPTEQSELKVDTAYNRDRGLVNKDVEIDRPIQKIESKINEKKEKSELKIDRLLERTESKPKLITEFQERLNDGPKKEQRNENEEQVIREPKRDVINEKADVFGSGKRFSRNSKDDSKDLYPAEAVDLIDKKEDETQKDFVKETQKEIIENPLAKERNLNQKIIDNLELKTDILSEHSNKYENSKDISESNLSKRSSGNPSEKEEEHISESRSLVTPELINYETELKTDSIPHSETTIYDDITDNASTEPVTEHNESLEKLFKDTDEYETQTNPPNPRFVSKLSYFQKNEQETSVVTNFIERAGKRKFKSKCRCEKIWNCPKLQITVPRCPNEYFLCC